MVRNSANIKNSKYPYFIILVITVEVCSIYHVTHYVNEPIRYTVHVIILCSTSQFLYSELLLFALKVDFNGTNAYRCSLADLMNNELIELMKKKKKKKTKTETNCLGIPNPNWLSYFCNVIAQLTFKHVAVNAVLFHLGWCWCFLLLLTMVSLGPDPLDSAFGVLQEALRLGVAAREWSLSLHQDNAELTGLIEWVHDGNVNLLKLKAWRLTLDGSLQEKTDFIWNKSGQSHKKVFVY